MARSRNIKPGFYKNEDLAECSVWARFIFPGLWMMADREGRLEYRPKRIKGELLPYDNQDTEPLLRELEKHGFILIYEVEGTEFIQIINFAKHQNPHHREAESEIPPPPSLGLDGVANKAKPEASAQCNEHGAQGEPRIKDQERDLPRGGSRADSLIPDSLIPDSGFSDSLIGGIGGSNVVGAGTPPSAAAEISSTLIAWERARGKVPRGISASNAQVMDLAAQKPTSEELRKAYDLAVADREATGDAAPINAGFVLALLAKVRSPPRQRMPSPSDARAQERADVIATLTGRKPANERTPETLDVAARRID
ncbi:hypothetical protein [Cupriavidus gilardii]|uniref:hypothetical protein n=1 Tax=Cupriavidus gilardii TaxID=82541 RepID=UPI0021B3CE39|nr:hypothetical protein [Cupriavidus gilardii]UXC37166.1 hypothetical protein N4G38_06890 [Cupriavidus gilardii]